MPNKPLEMYRYALVVCRDPKTGLYLIVSEKDGYWLPGGGVEKRESFEKAAVRETLEEAGIEVVLKGILRVEFTDHVSYGRMRVIYFAEPKFDNQNPKTEVDKHSLGASWMDLDELRKLELRGPEPKDWIKYLERGGEVFPLTVFDREATKP